jgi:hypothetical protein
MLCEEGATLLGEERLACWHAFTGASPCAVYRLRPAQRSRSVLAREEALLRAAVAARLVRRRRARWYWRCARVATGDGREIGWVPGGPLQSRLRGWRPQRLGSRRAQRRLRGRADRHDQLTTAVWRTRARLESASADRRCGRCRARLQLGHSWQPRRAGALAQPTLVGGPVGCARCRRGMAHLDLRKLRWICLHSRHQLLHEPRNSRLKVRAWDD